MAEVQILRVRDAGSPAALDSILGQFFFLTEQNR